MTTNYWEPNAEPQTQEYTFVVNTFDVNTDYVVFIQDPDNTGQQFYISCQTAEEGSLTIDGVINVLLTRFDECVHPFKTHVLVTAIGTSGSYTGLTITAAVAGLPITVTDASNPSGSTTLTAVRTNAGPYDVSSADNWSLGHIPATGEDIVFDAYDKGPSVNVSALSAIVLASATFEMTHTGLVGSEFAPLDLNLTGKLRVGAGSITEDALGSPRLNIRLISTNNEVEILNSCISSEDTDQLPVRLTMSGATGKCRVRKALMLLTVTGTLGTLEVSTVTADSDVKLTVSSGATVTNLTQYGGNTVLKGTATALHVYGGIFEHVGSAAMGTVTIGASGKVYLSSGGNITAINCSGVVNLRMNSNPRSIGACTLFKGYELYGYADIHTFTTGVIFDGCKVADGIFDLGQNYKLTPSIPA